MNRGGVGARSLNVELQKALNPAANAGRALRLDLCARDKVMQIENDYDRRSIMATSATSNDVDLDAAS